MTVLKEKNANIEADCLLLDRLFNAEPEPMAESKRAPLPNERMPLEAWQRAVLIGLQVYVAGVVVLLAWHFVTLIR